MATSNKCNHPPLHSNMIYMGAGQPFNLDLSCKRIHILCKTTLYIIDIEKHIRICKKCGEWWYELYLYSNGPDILASFDGETNLPIVAKVHNIKYVIYPKFYEEIRFGTFFHIRGYADTFDEEIRECIIYFPTGVLNRGDKGRYRFNDKYIICCIDSRNRFIVINSDGEIIEAIIVYPDYDMNRFKIGGGYLEYKDVNFTLIWKYTSASVLKTKPALSLAADKD